jgi:hypothetical protein
LFWVDIFNSWWEVLYKPFTSMNIILKKMKSNTV